MSKNQNAIISQDVKKKLSGIITRPDADLNMQMLGLCRKRNFSNPFNYPLSNLNKKKFRRSIINLLINLKLRHRELKTFLCAI